MNPIALIEKYYLPETPLYETLVEHSKSVCDKVLAIAAKHPELQIDVDFVAEAAMLHDIGIVQTDAPGIHCFGTHRYIEHGFLGAEMLRAEGLPRHALVCERHTGTGLSLDEILANNWPIPQRDMQPISIEEQLICYADKFFSKSHLDREISIERVREKLRKFGKRSVRKFDYWHELFG